MSLRSELKTPALLFAGMVLFGSATPLSKLVVAQFPVFTASLFRVLVGALVVLPFVGRDVIRVRELTRRDWIAVGGIALVGMFAFTTLLLFGMRLVPGVVGAIVMSATPAVTAAGSVLLFSDEWNRRKAFAIGLTVFGVVIIHIGGGAIDGSDGGVGMRDLIVGSILVLGAVCCEAGYTLIGKAATERLDPVLTVLLASTLAVPIFLIPAAAIELRDFDPTTVTPAAWLAIVVWGAGTLGLGSVLWYQGVKQSSGSVAAGFMGVMPVSALVLSYLLLSEPIRLRHLVGFAVVFTGVVVIAREHARGGHAH